MAEVLTVRVSECEPGMVTANDIVNEYGAVVLYKSSVLDVFSIDRLIKLGISNIKVYRQYEAKELKTETLEALYNNSMNEFKEVIREISNGKNVEIQYIQHIAKTLTSNFDSINDMIYCLNKVRDIDEYTYAHSLNVALLCSLLGKWLNLDDPQIRKLTNCGLLHDIGKSKVPQDILNKPDVLTPKEFEEIKKHPILGYKLLEKNIAVSKDVAFGVLMHHEREDGSGYPLGLTSDKIHQYAKIVAVVDVYDAMTSNRVYKKRQPPFDVLELYESEYLTKCDAGIMLTFLKHISSYYVGNIVRLNDGNEGEIVYINTNRIARPLIRFSSGKVLDLSMNNELKIIEML